MADPNSESEARFREQATQAMIAAARQLRQRQTKVEMRLWSCLRDRRLGGMKFRRQHPVANTRYVVDFLCYEARLIVEFDGEVHRYQWEDDQRRQADLEALGYRVLRVGNDDVWENLAGVLVHILRAANGRENAG